MNITEINGTKIKKTLGAKRCAFRYHNKNTRGGNFGFEIRGVNGVDLELSGDYDLNGNVFNMRLGAIYQLGARIDKMSMEELKERILKISSPKNEI